MSPLHFGGLSRIWWNLRNQRRIILRRGSRSFVLTVPRDPAGNVFKGQLQPLPQLHGTRTGMFGVGATSAYLDFTIIRGRVGKFQGIGVPDEYHRQGWATGMVHTLMDHYPDVYFYNSSLNEMSGPLFIKLRTAMPDRIAPIRIHEDGGYEVDTAWRPGQPRN